MVLSSLRSRLQNHYPRDEAANIASKITNNIFGGINLDELGRNKITQQVFRSVALAPDFLETNIRIGAGIAKGTFKLNAPELKAYRTFARNFVAAYASANVLNYISSGHWMFQNQAGHTFEIQLGKTKEGRIRFFRPFGTAVDFFRLPFDVATSLVRGDISSLFRIMSARLSIPLKPSLDLLANVDYSGRSIYGKDKYGKPIPPVQQAGGIASEIVNPFLPQYGQAAIDFATGKSGAEQAAAQALGAPLRYATPPKSTNRFSFKTKKPSASKGKNRFNL